MTYTPGSIEWFAQVHEEVIEPELPIVDPHHHLWPVGGALPYGLAELHNDCSDGHNIQKTVFIECGAAYRSDAPEHLRSLGETEFVARESLRDPSHLIAGIVAHTDLRRDDLAETLQAHDSASNGLLRGIRDALAHAHHPEVLAIPGRAVRDLYADASFRRGVAVLGAQGLTYDTWHYHYQNQEFLSLARAVPETTMVLDHFGTPLGVGPYESQREEIFEQWKKDIREIATCSNVVAKLGGLAMPDNGFGWHTAERPPTSDEFLQAQRRYFEHTIECFGPERCMFESNFPVDRLSLSYRTVWNAFKKLASSFSPEEKTAMFSATATRVYRL
jgi:predicted TIM-barrel fold metal-dependent hydrolase